MIPQLLLATGPSYIKAEINPISINQKGDILCKTRFESNWMGSHYYMDVNYGLCVLSNDSILEYPIFKLNMPKTEDEETNYIELNNYWNNWFENDSSNSYNITEKEISLIQKYAFNNSNLEQYKRTDTLSIKEFEHRYNIDLNNRNFKALGKAYSLPFITEPENSENIIVTFDFGNIVMTQSDGFDESKVGLDFSYSFPYGENEISFDIQNVSGVLFDVKRN